RLALILGAATVAAVVQVASAAAPTLVAFAASMAPIAVAAVLLDTQISTWVALSTDERRRGCVVSAAGVASAAAGAVGAPTLGWLCTAIGPRMALLVGGSVALSAIAVAGWLLLRMGGTDVGTYALARWSRRGRESLQLAA
ncbi:MAG: putative transporter, partial [Frankiales bacterium]|nr:putative transporter [Frankiales bacterium]